MELQIATTLGQVWLTQSSVHTHKNHSAANWPLKSGIRSRARIRSDLLLNWLSLFSLLSFLPATTHFTSPFPSYFYLYLWELGNIH